MPGLDKDELKALLGREIRAAQGYAGSQLAADRAKALDYYFGRPFGDEVEGRSQVVSRDVQETIEWMLPQLLRIFVGEQFVRFDPEGPEDVAAAEQQTEYVHHVINSDNDGFRLLYDWFKDALLSRVGIVTWGWQETECSKWETYTGLMDDQVELLLSDDNAEIAQRTEYTTMVPGPDGRPQAVPTFDIRLRRTEKKKRVKIDGVPPEEFVISRDGRSIDEASLVGHRFRATKSDLRELGVSEKMLDTLTDDNVANVDAEAVARDMTLDGNEDTEGDDSQKQYWIHRIFLTADVDGDGYNELREILWGGSDVLSNEPAEEKPYADLCPIRMPHRWAGQSYADLAMDMQRIKSTLWRQSLDNLYLSNNPQKEVVDGQVNISDLLIARVGGLVRVKQPGMIREITTTPVLAPALSMIEYTDTVRENRTGLARVNQGLDADVLNSSANKTASGFSQQISMGLMRVELVARVFAETGVKRLFGGVFNTIIRHQDFKRVIRLRNQWVPIDPREWRDRSDMTVTVGLGTGNKQEQMQGLQMIGAAQQQAFAAQLPIVTLKNLYHTLRKLTEIAGFKDVDGFFTDPGDGPRPQPQQPPQDQSAQIQAQVKMHEIDTDAQLRQAEMQADLQSKREQAQADYQTKMAEIQSRERLEGVRLSAEREKLGADHQQKQIELEQESTHFYDKLMVDTQLRREEIEVNAMGKTSNPKIEQMAMTKIQKDEGNAR